MVYNTRRKSLSLPSLGIHLPQSSRSSPSSSATKSEPPQKRLKRDHSPLSAGGYDTTRRSNLPLSPPPESRISHEGINDEIVSGVVDVLERSGNRPHTVKELAAVLAPVLGVVENSANPHAIISSRLNTYLKRPFSSSSASNQCVLSKELITTHPKRIYFYLSALPHQPIPNSHHPQISVASPTPTTPSTSDTEDPDVEENEDLCRRREFSPSPEVDLDFTSHELSPPSPVPSVTSGTTTAASASLSGSKSALSSPPLEGDEREFSQSAIYICRRSASRETSKPPSSVAGEKRNRGEYEADGHGEPGGDGILLGYPHAVVSGTVGGAVTGVAVLDSSSGLAHVKREDGEDDEDDEDIRESRVEPRDEDVAEVERTREESEKPAGLGLGSWGGEFERHLGSPESVELDELDHLFDF